MNALDIVINLSLLALMVLTQIGERPLNRWTYLRPALLTVVGGFFLGSVPDLYLYAVAGVGGALFGLVALALMRLGWDAQGRHVTARAGLAYAAVWVGVIGGRMLFAELATHGWAQQVGRFSYQPGSPRPTPGGPEHGRGPHPGSGGTRGGPHPAGPGLSSLIPASQAAFAVDLVRKD